MIGPKDVMACLARIVGHLDESLADPGIVHIYVLSSLAAQSVKVVVTGEGADELFGGYQRYALESLVDWYRWVPPGLKTRMLDWLQRSAVSRRVVQGVRALSQRSPSRRHMDWVGTFTSEELMEVAADREEVACEEREIEHLFQPFFDG